MNERYTLYHGDCLDILPTLPDNSVDLIVTDPPYFKVKNLDWDRQWKKPTDFLEWLDIVLGEFHRLLKPNGSLYLFASPQMGRKVANTIEQRFSILSEIRWVKDAGWHNKTEKEAIRSYLAPWEAVIFAEHYGAEGYAKGEAGYAAKCDELRGFVFEPLRAYLDNERERAGITIRQVAEQFQKKTGSRTVTGMAGHWFTAVQWVLPTEENYKWLRLTLSKLNHSGEYLRREYEDLRREYEDLRRPFNVSPDVPYTDVWTFPTVQAYPGKHECEKPAAMIRHIVEASSRPGAVVLDAFAGSGVVGEACGQTGRDVILIEKDRKWYKRSKQRTAAAYGNWDHAMQIHAPKMRKAEKQNGQLALFGAQQ